MKTQPGFHEIHIVQNQLVSNNLPSGKLTEQWNIHIFERKYIFNPGTFCIAMLDHRSVPKQDMFSSLRGKIQYSSWRCVKETALPSMKLTTNAPEN